MSKTITIKQLDTGYIVQLYESDSLVSQHAATSNDGMISKVRKLLEIDRRSTQIRNVHDTRTTEKSGHILANKPKYGILTELPGKWPIKKDECLVPELVPLPNNQKVIYAETQDNRVMLKYRSAYVYTTWAEIADLILTTTKGNELANVPLEFASNQKTAIRALMIAVRDCNLKPGDSVNLDPDKDFRKQLNRSSMPEYERGTLEDVIT